MGDLLQRYDRAVSQIRTDEKLNATAAIIAWIIAILTFGYMLPWAIAASRGKSNAAAIGVVNLFAGWTVIGWIIALVMACGAHQVVGPTMQYVTQVPTQPTHWVDPGTGHTLMMNPVTNQPYRIDPVTGHPWVEPTV